MTVQAELMIEALQRSVPSLLESLNRPAYLAFRQAKLSGANAGDADIKDGMSVAAEAYEQYITSMVAMRLLHSTHFSSLSSGADVVAWMEPNQINTSRSIGWLVKNVKPDWLIMVPDVKSRDQVYEILKEYHGDDLLKHFDPYRLITVKRMYDEAPREPSLVLFWNYNEFGKNDFNYRNFCEWVTRNCRASPTHTPIVAMR